MPEGAILMFTNICFLDFFFFLLFQTLKLCINTVYVFDALLSELIMSTGPTLWILMDHFHVVLPVALGKNED